MNFPFAHALKGIGGESEIIRLLGAAGVSVYIVATPGFVIWSMVQGHTFDLVAFCAAYPTGLGVAIGAVAGAVAVKDRNVATARITSAKADSANAANEPPAGDTP